MSRWGITSIIKTNMILMTIVYPMQNTWNGYMVFLRTLKIKW